MVTIGNRLLSLATLCMTGPALSFAPSLCSVRGPQGISHHKTGSKASSGGPSRRCFRRPLPSSKFLRASGGEEGNEHEVIGGEDGGDHTLPPLMGGRPVPVAREKQSKWARGQGDWTKPVKNAAPEAPREDEVMAWTEAETQGQQELSTTSPTRQEAPALAKDEEEGEQGQPAVTKKRVKKFYQRDFDNSSWTVAIQWRDKPYEVSTTKMFLKEDGSVVWLNKAKGQWKIRPKTRNISVYREFFWNWNGVRIFSAKLLENTCDLYLEGEIKGWTPFSPLSVMGWFQAVRRGIAVDENTPRPPWEDREEPSQEGLKRKKYAKKIVVPVDLN